LKDDKTLINYNLFRLLPSLIFRALKVCHNSATKILPTLLVLGFVHSLAFADDKPAATNALTAQSDSFGLFGWLDHRSAYNHEESFPQPLLVDDTSIEEGEIELSYLHTAAGQHQRTDIATAEVQKSFGVFTFELGLPYENFSSSDGTAKGIGDIELNARTPFYQYVSAKGGFDNTLGLGLDIGLPVNSQVSKYAELEPTLFDDIKLGQHLTLQTVLGYDTLIGGGEDSGSADFDYGLVLAYTVRPADFRLPGIKRITPMLEASGELGLNKDESGQNNLLGDAGVRLDFRPIGEAETSIALGYIFPLTSATHNEVHWGLAANFTIEF
jgi:hypothetical protein